MKDNKKKVISFIFVMVFVVTMFGCKSNKGVDEKQIINDIQQSDYLQKSNMTISDVQIEKRKTDIQNKSDTMIALINAKRDTMESKMYFSLTYTLYNDGWLIESITHYQDEDWKFIPLKSVSQENADTKIKEYSKNITSSKCIEHEEDLENGISYFTYELKEKYPYVTKSKTIKLNYKFNVTYNEGLYAETWEDTVDTVDSKEDWNINGTWKYNFNEEGINLNAIIKVNSFDGNKVDCSYDINYKIYDLYHFKKTNTFEVEEIPFKSEDLTGKVLESAQGFHVDYKTNADGKKTYANDIDFYNMAFCFDENRGVIFKNPYNKKNYNMTKN